METQPYLTWRDIKEYLLRFDDEQLDKIAIINKDDENLYITSADFNEEDWVWNDNMDEGCIPVSEYNTMDYGMPLEDGANKLMPKGTIPLVWAE